MQPEPAKFADEVAIIGIGLKFADRISTVDELWSVLIAGRDQIREVPADRWAAAPFYHPDRETVGTSVSRWGSFLDDIAGFDPTPFGLSVREARCMDPQQRLALEVAYEALEDATLPVDSVRGRAVGVFFGVSTWDYAMQQFFPYSMNNLDTYSATGMALSVVANRVSYCLDLKGPSLICDTACSSSLMAIHLAVRSLAAGDCEMAIAGGVNAILNPGNTIAFSKMGILSPRGRCRSFAAGADGFVRGEGAGAVLLVPLARALELRLPIYATIIASETNQDGATNGLAVPNGDAQIRLLESIYRPDRISPEDLGYFEAHGTGTEVGDAIEAHSIGCIARRATRREAPLPVGSVKTNFGHLEAASGILGFIKGALVCHFGVIPPNLHFDEPSPHIDFAALNIRIPTRPQTLLPGAVVGVNSFGFGGANVHIALRDARPRFATARAESPQRADPPDCAEQRGSPVLLPLSADSPQHLALQIESVRNCLLDRGETIAVPPPSLADLAGALAHSRSEKPYRRAIIASSPAEALAGFASALSAGASATVPRAITDSEPRIVFVFTGQGSQWAGMGQELRDWSPRFAAAFEACRQVCLAETGIDLAEQLATPAAQAGVISNTTIAQPMITAFQIALVELWRGHGIKPAAVVGHSVGEIAAAWAAGVLTLDDAMRTACRRGLLVDRHAAPGRMLAVAVTAERLGRLLRETGRLHISAFNAPNLHAVGGPTEEIERLESILERERIAFKAMPLPFAFHTDLMDPCALHFPGVMQGVTFGTPRVPFLSTVTGVAETVLDARYWWRNLRAPVLFAGAIGAAAALAPSAFLEISPHPTLIKPIQDCLRAGSADLPVVASVARNREVREYLTSAGRFWCLGIAIDLKTLCPKPSTLVALPKYPWIPRFLWQETIDMANYRRTGQTSTLLGQRGLSKHVVWNAHIDRRKFEVLAQHRLKGNPLFPASGYLDILYAAAREITEDDRCVLENGEIVAGLFLSHEDDSLQFITEYRKAQQGLDVYSRVSTNPESWKRNCSARLGAYRGIDGRPQWQRASAIMSEDVGYFAGALIYHLSEIGQFFYGPALRLVKEGWARSHEVVAIIVPSDHRSTSTHLLDPGVVDACFQPGNMDRGYLFGIDSTHYSMVPVRFGRVEITRPIGNEPLVVYFRKKRNTIRYSIGDIYIFDSEGGLLMVLENFESYGIDMIGDRSADTFDRLGYQLVWRPEAAMIGTAP